MVSSPRNEKRGLGSCAWRSWRQPYDLSTARSRAGWPSLYRAIVETACPKDTRNRIGSLILQWRDRSGNRTSARDFRADFGVPAALGERDNRFRRWVVAPEPCNYAQRRQHFWCRRAQFRLPRPMSLGNDVAQKPGERFGCALLRDNPDSHRAQLRIELTPIDPLLDQLDSGGRTSLLRNGKAGENDSVVGVCKRAHDCLVALGRVAKHQPHCLAADQWLVAGEVVNGGETGWQRAYASEQPQKLALHSGGGIGDSVRHCGACLVPGGLHQIVKLAADFRIVENRRGREKCWSGAHSNSLHEPSDQWHIDTRLLEQVVENALPFQKLPSRCASLFTWRALDQVQQNVGATSFAQIGHRGAHLWSHGAYLDRDLNHPFGLDLRGKRLRSSFWHRVPGAGHTLERLAIRLGIGVVQAPVVNEAPHHIANRRIRSGARAAGRWMVRELRQHT